MSCRIAAAAARLDQVSATGTVGPHVKTQDPITFFYLSQYRSACAVTKQHTGITVRPVCNTGKRFRPYNQNLFVQSGNNTLTADTQAIHKPAAPGRQVKTGRVFCPQPCLQQAGCGWIFIIRCFGSHNNQVQFFRLRLRIR